ncbi:MAG: CesT family type III secretion system chaperone [Pseudomonadota bacterium]
MECLFVNLLGELNDLLENPPLASDIEAPQAAELSIDGVGFLITHGRAPGGLLSVHCIFGKPAEAGGSELNRLLEMNLTLANSCAGSLGMHGENGDVVYVFHAPLVGLGAAQLLESLRHAAGQARAWRDRQALLANGALGGASEAATSVRTLDLACAKRA